MRNKFNKLESFIEYSEQKYHVIVVTETWLNENEIIYYQLENYHSFHSTRSDARFSKGGGVAIYILNSFDRGNEIGNKYSNGNNFLVVELLKEKKKIIAVYRQPNSQTDPSGSMFIDDLNIILGSFKNALVFGDFNINLFDSNSSIVKYKDTIALNDFFILNNLSVAFPTRIDTRYNTLACIDHVFSDLLESNEIIRCNLSYFDFVADHKSLCLSVLKSKPAEKNEKIIYFDLVDHRKIIREKLFEKLISHDFNEMAMEIKTILDNNTLHVKKYVGDKKPFITNEILKYINIKRNYERLRRKAPLDPHIIEKWKFYRNKVSSLCIKAKKKFLNSYFQKNVNDSKKIWAQINSVLGKQPKKSNNDEVHTLVENGIVLTDKKLMANSLNNYYINISHNVNTNKTKNNDEILNYHKNCNIDVTNTFECPVCTEDEVRLAIKNLKNSNSKDVFGMSNNLLKLHCESLTPHITKAINKHMFEGNFPDALKCSIVRPLYKKKGSKTDMKSYRPVSLIAIFSKIFESVIYRRLFEHCQVNDFFHLNQFGYKAKSNPETAMLHNLHDIYESINKRLLTALLTIDLTSAFDCIRHDILLIKLAKLKLPSFFMKLLESYLANRVQSVKIDGVLSDLMFIFCGSPQGGVLSGLFFNIYVNDIFKLPLRSTIRLYCDDISLIANGINEIELKSNLEHDIQQMNEWFLYHCLTANFTKTKYVLFSGRKKFENFTDRSLNLKFNNTEIERVECVKVVGLQIDETLSFEMHIAQLKNRIVPFVAKLAKIRRFISEKTALNLYYAHVFSHLIYMNAIWSATHEYLIESLGVIQRRALRIVFRKDRLCHNKELFSVNVLPISKINIYQECLTMHKILHNNIKNHVTIPSVSDVHSYNTRASSRNDFYRNNSKFILCENDFYFRATRAFNSLPVNVRKFHSINIFKKRLKEYLYEKYLNE